MELVPINNGLAFLYRTKEQLTAVHIAAKEGQEEVRRLLKLRICHLVSLTYFIRRLGRG